MTRDEAELILRVLNKQQEYFKCAHNDPNKSVLLHESKRLEAQLKHCANCAIGGVQAPSLFDGTYERPAGDNPAGSKPTGSGV